MRKVVKDLGLDRGETGTDAIRPFQYRAHMTAAEARRWTDLPLFAFVREPDAWWRSCYGHRLDTGHWPLPGDTDEMYAFHGDPFDEWYSPRTFNALLKGFAVGTMARYTEGADFVGAVETLGNDLEWVLRHYEGVDIPRPIPWENRGRWLNG